MLKKIFILLGIFTISHSMAQNIIPSSGNVSFGTTDRASALMTLNGGHINLLFLKSDKPGKGAQIRLGAISNSGQKLYSDIALYATGNGEGYLGFKVPYSNTSTSGYKMVINQDGQVGIGTTSPDAKLSVKGTIHSQEVKVDLLNWSDFVFEEKYELPTLSQVKNYIQQNGHLKDIPSTKEVVENGIHLGEMNSKLLQKIEELTLYTLEQEEKIKAQKTKILNLEIQINSELKQIEQQISLLKQN